MRKLLLLSFVMVLTLLQQAYAQSKTVSGTVTDQVTSQVLPGVAVIVKGTSVGTTTGLDGTYSIEVPASGTTLVFRFIGYKTVEREIGNAAAINIAMGEDEKQLQEVVVVAYGTADKGSFTGSAAQLGAKELANRPVTNVVNAIAGQAAGVQTNAGSGQPGSAPDIRIRGIGSINSSSDPLYVVDGSPYTGSIANLNMDDVESISILKDASSTALYGARATNGVVMITTKKGKKGSNKVNFRMSQGLSDRGINEYDRVDAYEYYPLVWEARRNSLVNAATPYSMEDANQIASGLKTLRDGKDGSVKGILGYNPFNVADNAIVGVDGKINPEAKLRYDDVDWFEPLQRKGTRSDYGLSYSGGSDKSDYYVSLGYLKEQGYVIKSDYERFTGRVNVNTQATDWLRTGFNVSGTLTESNQANTGSSASYVNPFNFARNMGPIYPVYAHDPATGALILDENGNKIYDYGNMSELGLLSRGSSASVGRHIVAETMWNDNLFNRNVMSARTFAEVTFLKDFKFTTSISADVSNYLGEEYNNNKVGDGAPAGRSNRTSTSSLTYTANQLLNYSKTFNNRHFVEALVGHENYAFNYKYLYGMRQGLIVEGNSELGNFTTTNSLDSRTDRHTIESYLSRVNYTFDDKYTVSGSFRRDGSSRFHKDVRWGDFWSVGASWRLDRETFITMPAFVDMLKLRGSYGQVGNEALLNGGADRYYGYQALYGLGYNNAGEPGFLQETLASNDLTWESNNSYDIGVEFDLFSRISGSVEYFNRESENLLFQVPLPLSSGVLTRWDNIGTMANTGFEVQLSTDVVKAKDFTWNVNLNGATYKNELKKLPQEEMITGTKKYMVGKSVYDYWLRDWYGVDTETGAGLFVADKWVEGKTKVLANGDSVTTEANNARFHYAGSAIPDFAGGITNTFTYKGLSLSVLLTYQVGGKVYDATYASLMNGGTQGGALHQDILNRWQNPGDVTNVPRMDLSAATQSNAQSDRWLIDASYLNIRSVNLNYAIPSEISSKVFMKNASVFASGENLGIYSKRSGMNVNQSYSGVTSNAYIPSRIYTVGLNVTL
ncbi:SusC/RagA family TonB-linked outer membrane protein [Pontibacter akesuensis]|uniref:TonB-linked outer membrane protein, SusC/RagA family n=1 Tax=Pontibacter akesuensis TaxID=388950 RepID=A0A1I7J841_9BACT|nr:TonB-dependent receptor [Pontibacter akesuensis]SFU81379.1 TonB-linked outer membrane protein, SusC/RagA family [Pontibacter akesuensis]